MDMLKAKYRKGKADSGCERVARLGLVWATGAGIRPGMGVGHRHPRSREDTLREGPGTGACDSHRDRGPDTAWPDHSTSDGHYA